MRISPKLIFEEIDKKVVGQDDAKRAVSSSIFLHALRFMQESLHEGSVTKKSNMMLLGPTGVGKTYMIREAAKAAQKLIGNNNLFPILEVDCTELTARGWTGDDISEVVKKHKSRHAFQPGAYETTIIFLDEFDKLTIPSIGTGGTDHAKNTQYNILKIMEGPMLFILAGNFAHVRHKRKENAKQSIGFGDRTEGNNDIDIYNELDKSGVATQILGRVSSIAELEQLDSKQLNTILNEHLLPEYRSLFEFIGESLRVPKKVKDSIVAKAIERKTGARGLNADLSKYIEDKLFDIEITGEILTDETEY